MDINKRDIFITSNGQSTDYNFLRKSITYKSHFLA